MFGISIISVVLVGLGLLGWAYCWYQIFGGNKQDRLTREAGIQIVSLVSFLAVLAGYGVWIVIALFP